MLIVPNLKITKNRKALQSGFTIIELLIATVVFSLVLVVLISAFVLTSRLFYKGVSMNNTQEATRTITQDISDDIKFAQIAPPNFTATSGAPGSGRFCIGLHRYRYQIGHQLGSTANDYALQRDTISTASGCPDTTAVPISTTTSDELLDNGMQLNAISINCSNGRCLVNVHVVFFGGKPNELFTSAASPTSTTPWLEPDAECTGALASSQYCAVADYNRTVVQRS